MTPTTPPLSPMPLAALLGRVEHEWHTRKKIFDLPTARFWRPDPELDLGFEFLGRPCATPIGPAAGPHSQLAQNIALAWLGGSRLFELKTVQVLDDLEINRPCIDMQTVGYNIEWSQELTVPQSLAEYVKASMLLELLPRFEPLAAFVGEDPGAHHFDMSVGYDLDGIRSDKVSAFLTGMQDATDQIDALRSEIRGEFATFADLDFRVRIADTLTLSTFHGCPPDEIEAIVKYLIDEHQLDIIVKLNPTLLGYETVAGIVNDELGYHDVRVKQEAFADDLQFERGIELIGQLRDYAAERGRAFGIKLTNTLVVDNAKRWMPDETMYLSGPPLHVLACTLLQSLTTALPGMFAVPGHDGDVMVSFSAGVTRENLADTLATGANPTTICSDLLKPGGYGRLAPMLKALTATVRDDGFDNLADWRRHRQAAATTAGYATACDQHVANIRGPQIGTYHRDGNVKLPREVDNDLAMFECVACNFCVTVCPNDAFLSVPSLDGMESRQQYVVLAELCNECGNCMTFCPERGDPAQIKPKVFTDRSVYECRTGQGFLIGADHRVVASRGTDEEAGTLADLLTQPVGLPLAAGQPDRETT